MKLVYKVILSLLAFATIAWVVIEYTFLPWLFFDFSQPDQVLQKVHFREVEVRVVFRNPGILDIPWTEVVAEGPIPWKGKREKFVILMVKGRQELAIHFEEGMLIVRGDLKSESVIHKMETFYTKKVAYRTNQNDASFD